MVGLRRLIGVFPGSVRFLRIWFKTGLEMDLGYGVVWAKGVIRAQDFLDSLRQI